MTAQEALHKLDETFIENWVFKLTLMEALEKQVPKKPTPHRVDVEKIKIGNGYWGKGTTIYHCPNCKDFISRIYAYCHKCGQALDWSAGDD